MSSVNGQAHPTLTAPPVVDQRAAQIEREVARTITLSDVLDHWKKLHDDWVNSDPFPDAPGEGWATAARAVVEAFAEGDLPASLRKAHAIIHAKLAPALVKWDENDNPSPPNGVRIAREEIEAARKNAIAEARVPRRLESARFLINLKPPTPPRQIAMMLFGGDDVTAVNKVDDELRQEGFWTWRADYVSPDELRERAKDRRRQEDTRRHLRVVQERIRVSQELYLDGIAAPVGKPWKEAPESIEELLRLPGISDEQVSQMKGVSLQAVRDTRKAMGLGGEPPSEADVTGEARGLILQHLREGRTNAEIQAMLNAAGHGVLDGRKIHGVRVWAENNPEQAEQDRS